MREAMVMGDNVQLKVFSGFSYAKGGIRIGVCQIGSPYLGLNSPASRHAQGRQQSRSVTSTATHVSHRRWSGEHDATFDSL